MVDAFRFKLRTDARFGVGMAEKLGELLKEKGYSNPIILIDTGVINLPSIKKIVEETGKTCKVLKVFENKVPEPTYGSLDEARTHFEGLKPDCVVGIGGGSTLDLAKGIATLMTNPGKGLLYRGFNLVKTLPLPVIAIPTTAGTGSEATFNAVFTEKSEKKKMGINTEYNFPVLAILDPVLITSCPKKVAVGSGMDAIVHTLESFVANASTPTSRMYAKQAFALLFNNLEKAVKDPKDIEAQSKVLLGSHYAGISLVNSGAGPAGAMSYPLGTYFDVPHGIAGAMFIPHVVKMNVDKGCNTYNQLYDLIDGADHGLSEEEKANEFSKEFTRFCNALDVPKKLNVFGVKKSDKELLQREAAVLKGAFGMNPVPFGEKEVQELLDMLID
ncbi:MAG: iron-containing alcohol dehydrogenase [Candidatus Micrarchaeota archaeon]